MLRNACFFVFSSIITLACVLLFNSLGFTPTPPNLFRGSTLEVNVSEVTSRLSKALQFRTISRGSNATAADEAAFDALQALLRDAFPFVHTRLHQERLDCHSRLFRWNGSDTSLRPMLLMSHLDVVPVEEGTERDWTHDAFSGDIADGYVWGRGALDIKSGVLSILEAVEHLLATGFTPRRTVYIAFGHDEELGGKHGGARTAELFDRRGERLEFVIDEGGANVHGVFPGITRPLGLLGIAEKGYATLRLEVEIDGGHSSMPPAESAIGILGRAVDRLEKRQMPASISDVFRAMLRGVAADGPWLYRLIVGNLWLFERPLLWVLQQKPSTNAIVRTTTAVTVFTAGTKDNVLPKRATALVNFRIRPGETVDDVVQHTAGAIGDSRVRISIKESQEPSHTSSTGSYGYDVVKSTMQQLIPDVVVVPYLVTAGTDAKYFHSVSDSVYRYMPFTLTAPHDLTRIHGTDERIAVEDYVTMIKFFVELVRNAQLPDVPARGHLHDHEL
eukprot:TRINITY_DN507_c1_g2_i1.p1 TRINITY_DN507_c1_g2~~TRINITY_DN507_c1_g2_i1.p1  ORF type:complete len:503 (-),score=143.34 TRINITY_DN507_c1_g2_i1:222-1730(-)